MSIKNNNIDGIEKMRFKQKLFTKTTFCVAFLTLLSAWCGQIHGQEKKPEKTTSESAVQADSVSNAKVKRIPLRVMYLPDPKSNTPSTKMEMSVLSAFRKKYPNIDISAFSGIQIQGIADESKIMLAIAGGNAPDVLSYIPFRMSDTYIQQAFLYPLDSFIERDFPGGVKSYMESVPVPIRPVLRREGPAIKGNQAGEYVWALPSDL